MQCVTHREHTFLVDAFACILTDFAATIFALGFFAKIERAVIGLPRVVYGFKLTGVG